MIVVNGITLNQILNQRKIPMAELLQKAIAKLSELPEKEQEEIASLILEEIADEQKWQKSFANSEKQLEMLAEEALTEFKQGKTRSFPT